MSSGMNRSRGSHSHKVAKLARDRLQRSPYTTVRNVSCHCEGGVVFLRGRLPSFYHKQLAQEALADLEGVTQVINETEVARCLT